MRRCVLSLTKGWLFPAGAALVFPLVYANAAAGDRKGLSVRDAVQMVSFVDPDSDNRYSPPTLNFKFSPERRYVAVVTQRSALSTDEFATTLWVYDVETVWRFAHAATGEPPPRPRALARMTAVSPVESEDSPNISGVRWLAGGKIAFLGRNKGPNRQLYVVDVKSGALQSLTPDIQDVNQFDIVRNTVVYTVTVASEPSLNGAGSAQQSVSVVASGNEFNSILFPQDVWTRAGHNRSELWVIRKNKTSPVLDATDKRPIRLSSGLFTQILACDPTGHRAVVVQSPPIIPPAWVDYQPAVGPFGESLRLLPTPPGETSDSRALRAEQYALVDLDRGRVSAILNAPVGRTLGYEGVEKAIWSQDGRGVLLVDTFLPLEQVGEAEKNLRAQHPCVARVDMTSGDARCVAPIKQSDYSAQATTGQDAYYLADVRWGTTEEAIVLLYNSVANGEDREFRRPPEVYELHGGVWSQDAPDADGLTMHKSLADLQPPLTLAIRQDLNTPPALYVSDGASPASKELWDPNPQLNALDLGDASPFKWRDSSGQDWVGGLVRPPQFKPGKRYPLVVQTHGFRRYQFMSVGEFTSANAARPMAAAGFIVLQAPDSFGSLLTKNEPFVHMDGYASAVDRLVADGEVAKNRVGIIGFSRTGFYVLEALEKDPSRYAAATIADSPTFGYWQYLQTVDDMFSDNNGFGQQFEDFIGAKPFGAGLPRWLKNSPGFNTDKIIAPLRIEAYGRASAAFNWETYATLRLQHKPVELLVFPNAPHEPYKPQERFASEQGNVDWFRFWLQGYEDPSQAKEEQYRRWEKLCDMQVAQNPNQPAFCVRMKTH
jgi:dipeptidyl aminopeptidase/acylaminoacyl peptidase